MNIYCTIISLTILIFGGCKNSKVSTNNQEMKNESGTLTETKTLESDNITDIYRISVSFISKGGGIDESLKAKYVQYIKDFNEKRSIKVVYEIANWGKEGETDYCFKLSELTKEEQQSFIDRSKTILKGSDLVIITENTSCRKK